MFKITLVKKAEILSEVRKRTQAKFSSIMHTNDANKAEKILDQDLLNLE